MSRISSKVHQLLDQIGAKENFITEPQLNFAVRKRMSLLGLSDDDAYSDRLAADQAEAQSLLDELLVRESCFFRDVRPFEAILEMAAGAITPLRILSAPSANGEEPYSVVIALMEAGFPADQIRVEALDISAAGIETSVSGRYTERRMHFVAEDIRQRYFNQLPDGTYAITHAVKECVHFVHANVLEVAAQYVASSFDIVLCRNLMIYLTADARVNLLKGLRSVAKPGALLIVGHAEAGFMMAEGACAYGDPGRFAFLMNPAVRKKTAVAYAGVNRKRFSKPGSKLLNTVPAAGPDMDLAPADVTPPNGTETLESIALLADSGQYKTARLQLAEFLELEPASAKAYSLQAFVLNASGDRQAAIASFEKAIYLDTADRQSVEHLLLLYTAEGNRQGVETMRRKLTKLVAILHEQ